MKPSIFTSPRRIMIVDDEAVTLDALARLVMSWGHVALPFSTFEEARASLKDSVPDAVVVDVRLGQFNGLQLLHLARQAQRGVLMLVVSGYDDPVLRSEAARLGAAYLLKPLDFSELRRLLAPVGQQPGPLRAPDEEL